MYQNIDISVFSKKSLICATDKDLQGFEITFSSPTAKSHDIRVETIKLSSRRFCAGLLLDKIYLNISEPIELDLIATDNGQPPRSTSTKLLITSTNDFPVNPDFDKAVYTGKLDDSLNLVDMETITINHYDEKDVKVEKTGEHADLFNVEVTDDNKITVSLSRDLAEEDVNGTPFLNFELKVSRSELQAVSSAGIVISVPIRNKISEFLQPLYDGRIDPPNSLTLDSIAFKTEEVGNVDFILDRNDSKYFGFNFDQNLQEVTLVLKTADNSWREKLFLEVQILAKLESRIIATTEVIIEVYQEGDIFQTWKCDS